MAAAASLRETIVTKAFLSRCPWQFAVVVIASALWLVLWHPTEFWIRLIGLSLQLCGVGIAFWGIFSFMLRPVVGVLSSVEASDRVDVRGRVSWGPGASLTIESRLGALEQKVTAMDERISKEIEEQFRKIIDALEATATKDSCKTLIGASWILFGTFLSTVSEEIHHLIAGCPYFGM
jgi:hypothetical protein